VRIAPFQAGVVVDADPSEHRDLLPAQSGHPPVAAIGGQARPLRGDPGSPGGQEVADLVPVVHGHHATFRAGLAGRPVSTRNERITRR